MKREDDHLKTFRILKLAELIILAVMEIFILFIILCNESLRYHLFSNKLLFLLSLSLWILMLFSLLALAIDFYLLRSTHSDNKELSIAAYTDIKTGLPNRYSVDMVMKLYETNQNMDSIGFALLRLSNLIEINNIAGHAKGDQLILDFSAILENVGKQFGFVGRNSGNEFIAIINECDDDKITQFISDLNDEIYLYNLSHEAVPISIEYNYALNAFEHTDKMGNLLKLAYQRLENMPLT